MVDPIYDNEELLHPSKELLEGCDFNFIKASREFGYQLKDNYEHDKAAQVFERLIPAQPKRYGEEDIQYQRSIYELASIRAAQGRDEEAESLLVPLLQLRKRVLGPEHPYTLNTLGLIADCHVHRGQLEEAEAIHKHCLSIRKRQQGSEHNHVYLILNSLGLVYKKQGRLELARETFSKATALEKHVEPEDLDLLAILTNLAEVCVRLGDDTQAEDAWLRVLTGAVNGWGGWASEHPRTLSAMESIAGFWEKREQYADARDLWQRVSDARLEILGSDHRLTLKSQIRLSKALHALEDYQQASVLAETIVQEKMKKMGRSSILLNLPSLMQVIEARLWLGMCWYQCDRWKEAERLFDEVISTSRDMRKKKPLFFLSLESSSHYWMGSRRWKQKRMEETLFHRRQALQCCREMPTPATEQAVMCMEGLAEVLVEIEQLDEVPSLCEEAIALSEATLGASSRHTIDLVRTLAYCYAQQRRYAEAKPLLDRVIPIREKRLGSNDVGTLAPLQYAAICADKLGEYAEAECLFKRVIPGYEALEGPRSEVTLECVCSLIDVLHQQNKLDEEKTVRAEWATKGVTFTLKRVGSGS